MSSGSADELRDEQCQSKSCQRGILHNRMIRSFKVIGTTTQPSYLYNLITVQPPRSTRSSSLVTLARPSTPSSLRITDRSFQYASPRLWNQLPVPLRQPRTNLSVRKGGSTVLTVRVRYIIKAPLVLMGLSN